MSPRPLTFGKYKGMTIPEVKKSGPDGVSYLQWLASQQQTDPKFAEANEKRKNYIMKVLNEPEQQVGRIELSSPKEIDISIFCMAEDIVQIKKDIAELKTALVPKDQEEW